MPPTHFDAMESYFPRLNASTKRAKPADADVREAFETLNMEEVKTRTIFLQANAGGGKTHSVIEYIKHHSRLKILALSHTKVATTEIEKRIKNALRAIPGNIKVRTFDSLALQNARKLLQPLENSDWCMYGSAMWYTKMVLKKVGDKSVTEYLSNLPKDKLKTTFALNRHVLRENCVLDAYDVVIVDEAQDLDPVALQFMEEHVGFSRFVIYVGDEKQTIYQKENIFTKNVTDVTKFQFTHTFRYDGKQIIDLINHSINPDARHTAFMTKNTSVEYTDFHMFRRRHGQTTILVSKWQRLLSYDCANMYISPKKKSDIRQDCSKHEKYKKQLEIYDGLPTHAKRTAEGDKIPFTTWMDNKRMAGLLDYSEPKWGKIAEMLDKNDKNKPSKKTADHITTVHQMKGDETKNVYIDISCLSYENLSPATLEIKENLYYVALTRAIEHVGCEEKYHPYMFTRWYEQNIDALVRIPLDPTDTNEKRQEVLRSIVPSKYISLTMSLLLGKRDKYTLDALKRQNETVLKRQRDEDDERIRQKRLKQEGETYEKEVERMKRQEEQEEYAKWRSQLVCHYYKKDLDDDSNDSNEEDEYTCVNEDGGYVCSECSLKICIACAEVNGDVRTMEGPSRRKYDSEYLPVCPSCITCMI